MAGKVTVYDTNKALTEAKKNGLIKDSKKKTTEVENGTSK